jgi:hypothetical protein
MRHRTLLLTCTTCLALGCGDGGTAPGTGGDGSRLAAQFERLADSVESGGYSPAAEALRHAAEIVRLTGHATPMVVTIDGVSRNFLAVAEQLDFPDLVCSWPSDSGVVSPPDTTRPPPVDSTGITPPGGSGGAMPGDTVGEPPTPSECTLVGTHSMRTLIAWESEQMAEVVRIVADVGNNAVAPGVPDIMTGLPAEVADSSTPGMPPDSGSGSGGEPGGFPGFMGEYLLRNEGSWWAVEGNQHNELEHAGGVCSHDRATFDWAEFGCEAARLRFEFEMTVEPVRYEPLTGVTDPPGGPIGRHTLAMRPSIVDGVRLTWVAWTPPPLPPEPEPAGPDPVPVDPIP